MSDTRVQMRISAITSHKSQYPDPIQFSVGEEMTLGERDSEYPGWSWVVTASGNAGWAPGSFIRVEADGRGVATQNYSARELNTVAGESLLRHKELHGWLWVENEQGERGWVPKHSTDAR